MTAHKLVVHKFGGTSIGDSARFSNVAAILENQYRNQLHDPPGDALPELVVVLSAMSGVTDQLTRGALAAADSDDKGYRAIKAALLAKHLDCVEALLGTNSERLKVGGYIEDRLHELEQVYRSIALLGELTVRGRDRVTSVGELLSAHILAALLRERGLRAEAVNATELIVTDRRFGSARPRMGATCDKTVPRLQPVLSSGAIPVLTGYIAASEDGVMTTLGRGGSDFSAAIIGACLDADEVWIWSDVDGILTADPNFVPGARTLDVLSYEEAAELAHYGAEVLHPRTIQPLVEREIPLRLLNSLNPKNPGTRILASPDPGRQRYPAIISTLGLSMIRLSRNGDASPWSLDNAGRALLSLGEAGLEVPMFSRSFSENSLNLVIRQADQAHCLSVLENRLGDDSIRKLEEQVATVSIVGVPDWNGVGIVSQTFAALGKHGARVIAIAQAASEHCVSICLPEAQAAEAVRFLHQELGLAKG